MLYQLTETVIPVKIYNPYVESISEIKYKIHSRVLGLEIGSHSETAIASPNYAQEEEERIPRVIVTSYVPGAIAISSVPQVKKVQEQTGSTLGVVRQEAIASTDFTQQKPEVVSQVVVTPNIEGVIATRNVPQQAAIVPEQVSKGISFPVPPSAKGEPVIPKKLSQEELNAIEDELKRLRINPDSCISVIKKYWDNVGDMLARVKEAIIEKDFYERIRVLTILQV